MNFRRVVIGIATTLAIATAPAYSAVVLTSVDVSVTDSATRKPVALARVRLVRNSPLLTFTNASGRAHLPDIPAGNITLRIFRKGYVPRDVSLALVADTDVDIALQPIGAIGAIGRTEVHALRHPDFVSASDSGSTFGDSLVGALDALPNVETVDSGRSSFQAIAIDGNGADQTGFSFDGVPLALGGSTGSLPRVAGDLFESSGLGGEPSQANRSNIDFHALRPTLSWQARQFASLSAHDSSLFRTQVTGSVGEVGVSTALAFRRNRSSISDKAFIDQSGASSDHGDANESIGALLNLQYSDDLNQYALRIVSSTTSGGDSCHFDVSDLPCGYGADDRISNALSSLQGTISHVSEGANYSVAAFLNSQSQRDDGLSRRQFTIPSAAYLAQSTALAGIAVNAEKSWGKSRLNSYLLGGSGRFGYVSGGTYDHAVATGIFRFLRSNITDTYDFNKHFGVNVGASADASTNAALRIGASAGLTFRPTRRSDVVATYTRSSAPSYPSVQATISAPQTAIFDCKTRTALITGGGQSGIGPEQSTLRLGYDWRNARSVFSLAAIDNRITNSTVNDLVALDGLRSPLPPDFISQLQALYGSRSGCAPDLLNPQSIMLSTSAPADRHYQAFSGFASAIVNRVSLEASITAARNIVSSISNVPSGGSLLTVGSPVPGTASFKAMFLVGVPFKSATILLRTEYYGMNNVFDRPPFDVVSIGLNRPAGRGRMSLAVANLGNIGSGSFITDSVLRSSLPDGRLVPRFAYPLTGRSIIAQFSVNVGRPAVSVPEADPTDGFSALPSITVKPLVIDDAATAYRPKDDCKSDYRKLYNTFGRNLRSFVASSRPRWEVQPFEFVRVREGSRSGIAVLELSAKALQVVVSCSDLHVGDVGAADQIGVVANPDTPVPGDGGLYFSNKVGLYLIQGKRSSSFSYRHPGASLPGDPLAITPSCPANLRGAASVLAAALRDAIDKAGAADTRVEGWRLTAHHDSGGHSWTELALDDPALTAAVDNCFMITEVRASVEGERFGGSPQPSYNYSKALGIFIRD